jgi:uncharacterized protein YciI
METERPGPPEVQFAIDTFEIVFLRQPTTMPAYDEQTVKSIQAKHLAYLFALQKAGKLKAAGAIVGHPSITGVGFFQLGSIDEVRSLMEADPSVIKGIEAVEVVTLICPKGAFGFPQSGPTPS